jgi:type VI secretion system protein ImpA
MSYSATQLMASPFAQQLRDNLEPLLAPISPENPAGESLRYDPLYDRIRQARRTEDDALPQGVWQRATQQADWHLVQQLTTDAITHRSKDLQLAVWRTEAMLHLYGLPGFVAGCELLFSLHGAYPVTMHPFDAEPRANLSVEDAELPLPAEDPAVETRVNLIQWMNEKLAIQLKLLPLTAPREIAGAATYSLADLESARLFEQSDQRRGTPARENRVKLFEASLSMTSIEWLVACWTDLQRAVEVTHLLDAMLDCVYGKANSGLLQIKHVLEDMTTTIASVLPPEELSPALREDHPEDHPEDYPDHAVGLQDSSTLDAVQGAIAHESEDLSPLNLSSSRAIRLQVRTREDAYRALTQIAGFLAHLEPHSPVPYLLRRAIAWGGMSLEELLPELLADGTVLRDVSTLLRLPGSNRSST